MFFYRNDNNAISKNNTNIGNSNIKIRCILSTYTVVISKLAAAPIRSEIILSTSIKTHSPQKKTIRLQHPTFHKLQTKN